MTLRRLTQQHKLICSMATWTHKQHIATAKAQTVRIMEPGRLRDDPSDEGERIYLCLEDVRPDII